jgi:chitosanase
VFTGDDAVMPSSAINNNYVTDFDTLKSMGDEFMADLVSSLGLSSTAGGKGNNTIQPTDPSNNITVTVEVNGVATKYVPA